MSIIIENVVGITHFMLVEHSRQFDFIDPVFSLSPTSIDEHGVDIYFSCLVLCNVEWLRDKVLLLLFPSGSQFFFERCIFCNKCFNINVRKLFRNKLFGRLCIQKTLVKVPCLIIFRIAACHKVQEIIQVFQAQFCHILSNGCRTMCRIISGFTNEIHSFDEVRLIHKVLETGVVNEDCKFIVPRHDKPLVHGVQPFHSKFHGPPTVQDRRRRINRQTLLRRDSNMRKAVKLRFTCQVIKVGHGITPVGWICLKCML